jgi:leucyl aminopeptidase (aminopeptidase T)
MKSVALTKSARIVIERLMGVKEGEHVTIFTDVEANQNIAQAVLGAAYDVGAEAILVTMTPREYAGLSIKGKLPSTLISCLKNSNAAVACTTRSVLGPMTELRQEMLRAGSRVMHMYLLSEEIALRTIPIDYEQLKNRVNKAASLFPKAEKVRITSREGADVTFSLKNRTVAMMSDGYCRPGELDMVPSGYVGISPVEGTANGTVVLDGVESGLGIGLIREPIVCDVKNGRITDVRGGFEARRLKKKMESADQNATNYAELGVGFNPGALPNTGNMIEDERCGGNILVGMGRNSHMGGKVESNFHFDGIIMNATLTVDGQPFLKDGAFQI